MLSPYSHHSAIGHPPANGFLRSRPGEDYDQAVTHPSELGVEGVVQLADRVINNEASEEQFLASLESAVGELFR